MKCRRLLAPVAVTLAAALGLGCAEEVAPEDTAGAERPAAAEAASPSAPRAADEPYQTQLYSERDAVLYSRLGRDGGGSGVPVDSIEARVGDRVEAGEVLAVLEDREAQLAVEAARPPYEAAAAEFERLQGLREREAASEAELEKARYEMQRLEAALNRAELTLQRTRIRAPFDGVVAERSVGVAEHVTPEMPLFRVTALSPLRARLQLPEDHPAVLEPGTRVTVRGLDGDTATAEVVTVAPTIDPASGTRAVVVQLLDTEGFEPGASVRVELGASASPEPGEPR